MRPVLVAAAATLVLALPASAQEAASPAAPSPSEIVAAAPAAHWAAIPAEDLLVMTLAPDAEGKPRTVVIQLMPAPFSQGWVHNIRLLARAGWYDGISVNRVQDNYVTQWGDPNSDNPEATGKPKPLPEGLKVMAEGAYLVDVGAMSRANQNDPDDERDGADAPSDIGESAELAAGDVLDLTFGAAGRLSDDADERERIAMISILATQTDKAPHGWHDRDSVAEWVEFWRGWPIANRQVARWFDNREREVPPPSMPTHEAFARGYTQDVSESWFWPVHCYGMVGVGRDYSPDTGSGAELYAVIGHAPRHLDRNIALVGRVIEGMEHLSSLPRGSGALGFYTAEEAHRRTPILSVRVASDLPEGERPVFEYLDTDSETFARYIVSIANRRDPFFITPAGGADICNIRVPVRPVSAAR